MAREGIRAEQAAFYWGAKTTAEISAIPSGDIAEGDLVYNKTTSSLWIRLSASWKDLDNYAA